jgi:hypothetical protein
MYRDLWISIKDKCVITPMWWEFFTCMSIHRAVCNNNNHLHCVSLLAKRASLFSSMHVLYICVISWLHVSDCVTVLLVCWRRVCIKRGLAHADHRTLSAARLISPLWKRLCISIFDAVTWLLFWGRLHTPSRARPRRRRVWWKIFPR